MASIRRIYPIFIFACISGMLFDILFWKNSIGISVLIFVSIYLAGLFCITTYSEGQHPPLRSLILVIPILFFSAMIFLRAESVITLLNFLMLIVFLVILSQTWLGGQWYRYSLSDFLFRSAQLFALGLIAPLQVYLLGEKNENQTPAELDPRSPAASRSTRRWVVAIIMGFGLSIPIVVVLGLLLSSADPVFQRWVNNLINWTSIQEFVMQAMIILFISYTALSGILFSLLYSLREKLIGLEKPLISPFLDWITALIVLVSVNLLFFFFLGVQVKYFFGGQSNITYEGFTYAEYTRRGFTELIAVGVLSLFLLLALGMFTLRANKMNRIIHSAMGTLLVMQVAVILLSALNRLYLYEYAYGFSIIRAVTHIFTVWLAILLAAAIFLEWANNLRRFALALLLVVMGFSATLSIINIDGWIVHDNGVNTMQGKELDTAYLLTLSDDSVPALFELYHNQNLSPAAHSGLGWVLLCHQKLTRLRQPDDNWASFQVSRSQARQLYQQYENELKNIPAFFDPGTGIWNIALNGINTPCQP